MKRKRKFKDLSGYKYGRITVLERADDYISPKGDISIQWKCYCDCGKKDLIICGKNLISGNTKSCGCIQKENSVKYQQQRKQYNIFKLSENLGVGYTLEGDVFYFDLDDYDKIKNYYWSMKDRCYVTCTINKKLIYMHRFIMNCPNNYEVDHINHITNDNRKQNLRIVNKSKNLQNQKLSKNNTSGYTGVCWNKQYSKWVAYIKINKKNVYLGRYIDIEDAIKARKEAEEKYFGEYSYDNSMNNNI